MSAALRASAGARAGRMARRTCAGCSPLFLRRRGGVRHSGGVSAYWISCPARVLFTDRELVEQEAVLDGAFEVEPALWCALEAGHAGLHHALAQGLRAPGCELWTRWPDGDEYGPQRATLPLPSCQAVFLPGTDEEERCLLPCGHPGRHGFEFGPPVTEADALPEWLLRRFYG